MFLPQAGRAWEVGKASPLLPPLFLNLKNTDSLRRESSQPPHSYNSSYSTMFHISFNKSSAQRYIGCDHHLESHRNSRKEGWGEEEKNWLHASIFFFLTSCLPLLYFNTRTSLAELSVISNFQVGEGTL